MSFDCLPMLFTTSRLARLSVGVSPDHHPDQLCVLDLSFGRFFSSSAKATSCSSPSSFSSPQFTSFFGLDKGGGPCPPPINYEFPFPLLFLYLYKKGVSRVGRMGNSNDFSNLRVDTPDPIFGLGRGVRVGHRQNRR